MRIGYLCFYGLYLFHIDANRVSVRHGQNGNAPAVAQAEVKGRRLTGQLRFAEAIGAKADFCRRTLTITAEKPAQVGMCDRIPAAILGKSKTMQPPQFFLIENLDVSAQIRSNWFERNQAQRCTSSGAIAPWIPEAEPALERFRNWCRSNPDFLWSLWVPSNSMRLSVKKAAPRYPPRIVPRAGNPGEPQSLFMVFSPRKTTLRRSL